MPPTLRTCKSYVVPGTRFSNGTRDGLVKMPAGKNGPVPTRYCASTALVRSSASTAAINTVLDPIRERRAQALAKPGYIRDVAIEGSKKAQRVAHATMERVREAVKLKY